MRERETEKERLTDAVVDKVKGISKLQSGWVVPLTEDPGLHERREVVSSVVRGFRGARVIATYPHQPRVNDVVCHQFLPEEDEPELVVGGRLSAWHCVVRPLHTHKGNWKGQPVIVGVDSTKQLCCIQGVGVRGCRQGDVFV